MLTLCQSHIYQWNLILTIIKDLLERHFWYLIISKRKPFSREIKQKMVQYNCIVIIEKVRATLVTI